MSRSLKELRPWIAFSSLTSDKEQCATAATARYVAWLLRAQPLLEGDNHGFSKGHGAGLFAETPGDVVRGKRKDSDGGALDGAGGQVKR